MSLKSVYISIAVFLFIICCATFFYAQSLEQSLAAGFITFLAMISAALFVLLYFLNIGPLFKLEDTVKKQQFASNLIDSLNDSIFVHKFDGSFIYVNEAASANSGYSKEELLHMRVQDLDYHDEKSGSEVYEENIKNVDEQLEKNERAVFETFHKNKNGTVTPLEIVCRVIQDGKDKYLVSIARDITHLKTVYKNLEISENKYRNLVENSQIGIFNTKINGEILYINSFLKKIMGYDSQDDIYKQNIINAYKDSLQRERFIERLKRDGMVDKAELKLLTKNGEERSVQVSAHIENNIISGICTDVTESKKAIEEITKLSRAMEEIDDLIMITDRAGRFTYVNDAYVRHTGFSREESIGKSASILKSGMHESDYYQKMWDVIRSGNVFRGLIINRKKDGELYYEEKTISPIKNDDGIVTSYVSTGKDITQRIMMEKDLEKLATTDKLTGIYNRHKFEEIYKTEIERVLRYENSLTLIMFDIDHFKKVNDTYGHDVGDSVIKNIVDVVNKNIRTTDIFVRWGGEEFIILCPETDSSSASTLAEKLRSAIEATQFDKVGRVTCSFGVAIYSNKESGDNLIKRSDDALYMAKNQGRNRVEVI